MNQWINLPETDAMRGLPRPTFNILKRVASLFVASLTSSGVTIRYEPLAYYDGNNMKDPYSDAAHITYSMVQNLWEKFKMDYRVRDALFDGATVGDYCAHFYFDPFAMPYGGAFDGASGEIKMEMVDGINVMFGNPNDRRVQEQPYIILVGRDTVENLREEAKRFREHPEAYGKPTVKVGDKKVAEGSIQPDMETQWTPGVGGKTELEPDDENGKALFLYLYEKRYEEVEQIDPSTGEPMTEDETDADGNVKYQFSEDGEMIVGEDGLPVPKRKPVKRLVPKIYVTKATRNLVIYEHVDTGLSLYPIAWGNWEKQKNQYHGRALVTGLINNQIFINQTYALAQQCIKLMAFPKTIYNADLVSRWTNEVGQAIGVHGLAPGTAIQNVAYNLQPADMSGQLFTLLDRIVSLTKECLGATDAQMGNVNPENTSALMVLQTNSEVPLENVRSGLYEWVEDVGSILPDMMGTYYGKRKIIVDREFDEPVIGPGGLPQINPMTGMMQTQKIIRKVVQEFDFNQLKWIAFNLRIDAGATTYFSEIAMTQTLDNLRKDGTLDLIQYLERIPDKLIPKKQELIDELKGRIAAGTQANAAAGAAIPEPGSPVSAGAANMNPVQGGPLSPEKAVQGLPTGQEAGFEELPNIAKKTALAMGSQYAE